LRWATGIVVVLLLVAVFLAVLSTSNANQAEDARSTSVANAELANFESTRAIEAQTTSVYNEEEALLARGTAEAESTRAFEAQQIAVTERADAIEARATSDLLAEVAATSEAQVADLKNRIQASQLAAASDAELKENQELALLLVTAGLGISPQPDTVARFYSAIFTPFRRSIEGHEGRVLSASFSPDGQRIVTASVDGSAKVWDVAGNEEASLEGHEGVVTSASFTPDGQRIVTASEDGSAKLWDLAGNEEASLEGHTDSVRSASFTPDGQRIVTASADGSAKVWAIYPSIADKLAVARARLSNAFTDDECRRYFRNDPENCPQTLEALFALFDDDLQ
jgi:WD40 repeat protein